MSTLKVLSRTDILEADDRIRELVKVPEWGGSVWVRSLEGRDRDRIETSFVAYSKDAKGRLGVDWNVSANELTRARLVSMTAVGEDWAPLFTEADILALAHKNASALDRLFSVAQRLSGLSDRDVEALTEQLGEAPGSGSPSVSRKRSG